MANLDFYTNPQSRGRMVRWMLEEVQADYTTHLLEYDSTMKAPDYLAINPMGKVPTLVHDGTVVTECAAICCHLADVFPQAGLAPPPGSPERGAYYRWMFFAAGPLETVIINRSFGFELPEGPMATRRAGWGRFEDVVCALAGLLEDGRPYLMGDTFSALDVYLGSQIAWGQHYETMPALDVFTDYAARITTREAAVRARALDDAAMAGAPTG